MRVSAPPSRCLSVLHVVTSGSHCSHYHGLGTLIHIRNSLFLSLEKMLEQCRTLVAQLAPTLGIVVHRDRLPSVVQVQRFSILRPLGRALLARPPKRVWGVTRNVTDNSPTRVGVLCAAPWCPKHTGVSVVASAFAKSVTFRGTVLRKFT